MVDMYSLTPDYLPETHFQDLSTGNSKLLKTLMFSQMAYIAH